MQNEKRKKILIVEDDFLIRDLYSRLLKKGGYEVDVAEDGEEGYADIINGQYDLILLDIMLPKMSGIDILKKLQQEQQQKKIVMLTNLDTDTMMYTTLSLGAKGFVIKDGIQPGGLGEVVEGYLQEKS